MIGRFGVPNGENVLPNIYGKWISITHKIITNFDYTCVRRCLHTVQWKHVGKFTA